MKNSPKSSHVPPDLFAATRWSVVLTAADSRLGSQCQRALSELCQAYWFPVFVYLRRRGHSKSEAEDLTQDFFARLVKKKGYASADPDRGRFRAFLLTSLKNFVRNKHRENTAQKRGGGVPLIELDAESADGRYRQVPEQTANPDRLFDRVWAQSIVDTTLQRLREDYTGEGKALLFEQLANGLTHPEAVLSQAAVAERLGTTEAAVKSSLRRLRQRYRSILRDEIAQTTAAAEDVDAEIRHLINCLT